MIEIIVNTWCVCTRCQVSLFGLHRNALPLPVSINTQPCIFQYFWLSAVHPTFGSLIAKFWCSQRPRRLPDFHILYIQTSQVYRPHISADVKRLAESLNNRQLLWSDVHIKQTRCRKIVYKFVGFYSIDTAAICNRLTPGNKTHLYRCTPLILWRQLILP